jgi:hypothetical protein
MKSFLFYILIFWSVSLMSQGPAFNWAKSMGASYIDQAHTTTIDSSGNLYVAGSFYGTIDFDPGPGSAILTANGNFNAFITKFNPAGNLIWAKAFIGTHVDIASIKVDVNGNVITTGMFIFADFDPGPMSYTLSTTQLTGYYDAFVCKLDSNGVFMWAGKIGSGQDESGSCLAVDGNGDIYVTGSFQSVTDFDPGPGTYTLSAWQADDAFICKFSSLGSLIWAYPFTGQSSQHGLAITVDNASNVFVAGSSSANVYFMSSSSSYTNLPGVFVAKFNSVGTINWFKSFNTDYCTSMKADNFGNIYLKGTFIFQAVSDFDPGPNQYTLAANNGDTYINKLDTSGNFKWARNFAMSCSWIGGNDVDTDNSGNVYSVGNFAGTCDFDPGAGTYTLSDAFGSVFVNKFDSLGNFLWARNTGDTALAGAISVDMQNNIYFAGFFYGSADFNPHLPVDNHVSLGSSDIYISRWNGLCVAPPPPVNTTTAGNLNICVGYSTMLSVLGQGLVSWYSGPASTTPLNTGINYNPGILAAGQYSYYAEDYTCMPSNSKTQITITVNPLPTITLNGAQAICVGETTTITATGAISYTWSTGATSSVIMIVPVSTNVFSVTGIDANSCSSVVTTTVFVDPCTGVERNENERTLELFPNPGKGIYYIVSTTPHGDMEIYDGLGQKLEHSKVFIGESSLDLSKQSPGLYYLRVNIGTPKTVKIIKE